MKRLTNLDTSFLRLEHAGAPMHVGGCMTFEAPAGSPMTFARLRGHMARRVHAARVFHEWLVPAATPLANPSWAAGRPVDLDDHLQRAVVNGPLTDEAIERLVNAFYREMLPRDRPLWQLLFIEEKPSLRERAARRGEPTRFAIALKVHHAAVDGVSAEAALTALLDFTPDASSRVVVPAANDADATPRTWSEGLRDDLRESVRIDDWRSLAKEATTLGRRYLRRALDDGERSLPNWFSAPPSVFNAPISRRRVFPVARLPMAEMRRVQQANPGTKLNDVVLAVCGGALRAYLAEQDALPADPMVAMAPISKRAADQKHAQGNQVSSMLVRLGTDIADPVARLAHIAADTKLAKAYNREMPVEHLFDRLPSAGPALFLGGWRRAKLSRRVPPLFNVVITNVPGSPVPLYLDGARMTGLTGMAGIYDGAGLVMVVTSYLDTLAIGINSTPELMRDPGRFIACLQESFRELSAASGVQPDAAVPQVREEPRRAVSQA